MERDTVAYYIQIKYVHISRSRSYRGDSNFNALLTPLTFLVTYFNSGVNPLLYAFLSRNFRKGMKELLLCSWKKGKGKSSSNSSMHHKRKALQVSYPATFLSRLTIINCATPRPIRCPRTRRTLATSSYDGQAAGRRICASSVAAHRTHRRSTAPPSSPSPGSSQSRRIPLWFSKKPRCVLRLAIKADL